MERDFMGLNSKDSVVVKEEFAEGGCEDSEFARSSGISWPSPNKVSALPQFMSLKCEQDERPSKNEAPFSMMSPFLKAQFMVANQKFGGGTNKQQVQGGNAHTALPSAAEQWLNNSKATQLTIFYGGTVNVFDDISPEKAQAIMLLAGNAYVQSNTTQSKLHMQTPPPKHPAADQPLVNPCMNVHGLRSPVSVTSHPVDQSGANNDDFKVSKTAGMPTTLVNKAEPPRVMSSMGSVAVSAIMSSAVPQARKASLARFLEKRKERVMSAAPYKMSSKAADCGTPESNYNGISATCSSSLSVNKERD